MKRWFFVLLGVGVFVFADRWLKWLAFSGRMYDFGFGKFFLVKNDALVFSWPAPNNVAIALMFAAIIVVMYLMWRIWRLRRMAATLGCVLIILGAISNLYDRIYYGFVIDWGFFGRWWPVFNLADVMIAVGVILLIVKTRQLTQHHNG